MCAALAAGAGPSAAAWPAGLALAGASLVLALGGLEYVQARASRWLIAAAAGWWGATSLVAAWLDLADRAGTSPLALRSADLAVGLTTGLAQLVCFGGAVTVLVWSFRPFAPTVVVAVIAAVGVLAVATTGHAATGTWAPLLVGVHALAAAWWAGTLAALAMTVRGRSGWAAALPEFSRYALVAVCVLAATGTIAAVDRLGVGAQWLGSGYGRVVLAKIVVLMLVLGMAAAHRRRWVPSAARHRTAAEVSLRRAVAETALLALALGLAAGLASTGPG